MGTYGNITASLTILELFSLTIAYLTNKIYTPLHEGFAGILTADAAIKRYGILNFSLM